MTDGVFGSTRRDGVFDGVTVGLVADDADPRGRGRVKVEFPEREDDAAHWARIAVPMAGDACGTYYQPAVGDEVLVAFGGGDVHRPFVVGSLWNGEHAPPRDNSDGDNQRREVRSRSGHSITFDDADDGGLTIRTDAGHRITIDDGGDAITLSDESGSNRLTLDGENGEVALESAGELALSAPEIRLDGEQVRIEGEKGVSLASKGQLDIESGGRLAVASRAGIGIESTGILTIEGSLIQLN